jgi:chemotaxis protein methyltransferase CheR
MSPREDSISPKDFQRLCRLIYQESGIRLNDDKKTMLEQRIKRRLRSLDYESFAAYCNFVFGPQGHQQELVHLLDVVSTNKTDFFREAEHFDVLTRQVLPELMARNPEGRTLLFWSAGCSTGEEPYTLAIVLQEYHQKNAKFRFRLLGTDISTLVLKKASMGVFNADVLRPVAPELQKKYFMRSRDPESKLLRVIPELRRLVEFRRLNFMDADFGLSEKVDVIFCRNVIIYFDRPTQEQIVQKLASNLLPTGYAFLGHSESLHAMDVPLTAIAPAVYRKSEHARS